MKIQVTFEKADIMRLVLDDLERRRIKVKAGSVPEYKGALQVSMSVEADDEVPAPADTPVEDPAVIDLKAPVPDVEPDMSTILDASKRVAATKDPLQRKLGPNESVDFPRE